MLTPALQCSFESSQVCQEIIKNFHNTPVAKPGSEEQLIQIRFADTQDQKNLKQQTAAARQFRTAEYEFATQGHTWGQLHPLSRGHGVPSGAAGQAHDFESYLANSMRLVSVWLSQYPHADLLQLRNAGNTQPRSTYGTHFGSHLLPNGTPTQTGLRPPVTNITPPTAVKFEPVATNDADKVTNVAKKPVVISNDSGEQK